MFGARKDEGSIDIEKYLKKFIDFSMVLGTGIINDQFEEKYRFYFEKFKGTLEEKKKLIDMLIALLDGIDIRRQEKIIEKANLVHSLVCTKPMDISLMGFEIMFAIMIEWQFYNLECITRINEVNFLDIQEILGVERLDLLKELEEDAYQFINEWGIDNHVIKRKSIRDNLNGRIFWYFSEIFCEREYQYADVNKNMQKIEEELQHAISYFEFCEVIQ